MKHSARKNVVACCVLCCSMLAAHMAQAQSVQPQELQALRDAFKKKPKKSSTTKTTQKTKKNELDALRDAFRRPVQKNSDDDASLLTPPPQPKRGGGWVQQLANTMNPAISIGGIFAAGWSSETAGHCHADGVCHGDVGLFGHTHDPTRTGFNLQQIEMAFTAAVDPFFTAAVILSLGERDGKVEVEIEEAYMQSTALPWRFQLKLGKFLSETTRLGAKHLHDLDFATIALPVILSVGGEMRHYGAQLTWLAPWPFYFRLGAEMAYGGSVAFPIMDASIPTFIGHLRTYWDTSPSTRLLLGAGIAYGIWDRTEAGGQDLGRIVSNAHILFQWRPPNRNNVMALKVFAGYYGVWSQCDPRKSNSKKPNYRQYCVRTSTTQIEQHGQHGITGKVVLRFAQQWHIGTRFDWVDVREPSAKRPAHRLSAMLLFVPTEFSRIRLQYDGGNLFNSIEKSHAVWLQLQFSIGSHGAHAF